MTDRELQEHVQNALDWEPGVDAADIGVTVDNGVVALRGDIKTFAEKAAAERVALRVYGVKAVANDLVVRLGAGLQRTDTEIAQAAVNVLKWNSRLSADPIAVAVSNGWVTLKGAVNWNYQRDVAAKSVRDLTGVVGVTNNVTVRSHVSAADVQSEIQAALKRSAEVDARRINVTAIDGKVILSGNVRSWAEREEARHAAWAAPGVRDVEDRMAIIP
jgi:osmotically-inducible protein OsmY